MGGFIAPSTTIGGSVLAPGIPLASSPLSGLFQIPNGLGFAVSQKDYFDLSTLSMNLGYKPPSGFGVAPIPSSPIASTGPGYGIAVSPDGRFVASTNGSPANSVSMWSRNIVTGGLTAIVGSPYATGTSPGIVRFTPDGAHLIVASYGANNISVFAVNSSTGALTAIGGSPYATGNLPHGFAISPDGTKVYVANAGDSTITAFTRNLITGALTPVAGSPFAAGVGTFDIAVAPRNNFLFACNLTGNSVSAYSIASSGVLTPVAGSPFATDLAPRTVAISSDGLNIYTSNQTFATLTAFSVNQSTGVLSEIPSSPIAVGTAPHCVYVSPDGLHVLVVNYSGATMSVFSRAPATGVLTPIVGSPFALTLGSETVTMSPDGQNIYVAVMAGTTIVAYQTTTTSTYNLLNAIFDPQGGLGGTLYLNGALSINGALTLNGGVLATYPSFVGQGGKFLRVNTAENGVLFDGVNTNIPVAMVANAGALAVGNSGNYIVDLSGVLTAQGTLTITHSVPTNTTLLIFDNATTGAFALVTAGTLGVFTIPRGKSIWYWNGTTCEYISGGGFYTPNVTPLPAAGSAVTVPHYLGVTPSWISLELICLTAELGYAIGDVVEVSSQSGATLTPIAYYKNTTIVGFSLTPTYLLAIANAATGVYVIPTAANWAYRFGIDR